MSIFTAATRFTDNSTCFKLHRVDSIWIIAMYIGDVQEFQKPVVGKGQDVHNQFKHLVKEYLEDTPAVFTWDKVRAFRNLFSRYWKNVQHEDEFTACYINYRLERGAQQLQLDPKMLEYHMKQYIEQEGKFTNGEPPIAYFQLISMPDNLRVQD